MLEQGIAGDWQCSSNTPDQQLCLLYGNPVWVVVVLRGPLFVTAQLP